MHARRLAASTAMCVLFAFGAAAPASAQAAATTGPARQTDEQREIQILQLERPLLLEMTIENQNAGRPLVSNVLREGVVLGRVNTPGGIDGLTLVEPDDPTEPGGTTTLFIVGGQFASIEEWPSIVSFRGVAPIGFGMISGETIHYCGGTAVAPDWVLTAAHCVSQTVLLPDGSAGFEPAQPGFDGRVNHTVFGPIDLIFNTDDLGDEARIEPHSAVEVVVHPAYQPEIPGVQDPKFDIALVRLGEPWLGPVMALSPSLGRDPAAGAKAQAAGFGALSGAPSAQLQRFERAPSGAFSSAGSQWLQYVGLAAVDSATCASAYPTLDPATQLCAGFEGGGFDSCTGDSGGPLAVRLTETRV